MANNNLLQGNPDTQFTSGRVAVENGKLGGEARAENIKKQKQYKDQLKIVIGIGQQGTLAQAKEKLQELEKSNNQDLSIDQRDEKINIYKQTIEMIEQGGLIAYQHVMIAINKKVKTETRLKALETIVDRLEGKPVSKTELTGKDGKELMPPIINLIPAIPQKNKT